MDPMVEEFECPGCEEHVRMTDSFGLGEMVECSSCGATLYLNGTAPCCWTLEGDPVVEELH